MQYYSFFILNTSGKLQHIFGAECKKSNKIQDKIILYIVANAACN